MRFRSFLFEACILLLPIITGLAVPGSARADDPLVGYDIVRLGRGHNNVLCLAATISGKKGLMILDTGAAFTLLNKTTYQSLLPSAGHELPKGIPKTVPINGMASLVAMAPDFRVGNMNLGSLPVALVPQRYLYESPLERKADDRLYDGLMGENLLRRYNAIVDCGRLILYLNVDPSKKHSFSAAFTNAGWTRVPMSDIGNNFAVPCTINGHHFRFIIDTGAPFTAANTGLLAAANIEATDVPGLRGGLIGTTARDSGFVTLPSLQIGDYTAVNVHSLTTPQSFVDFGGPHDSSKEIALIGLFGSDNLAANNAVIDVGNKTLYLKHSSH